MQTLRSDAMLRAQPLTRPAFLSQLKVIRAERQRREELLALAELRASVQALHGVDSVAEEQRQQVTSCSLRLGFCGFLQLLRKNAILSHMGRHAPSHMSPSAVEIQTTITVVPWSPPHDLHTRCEAVPMAGLHDDPFRPQTDEMRGCVCVTGPGACGR